MGLCTQYAALLKKNVILKRRQYVSTLFELCLPAVVFLVLVIVKELLPPTPFPASLQMDRLIKFKQTTRVDAINRLLVEHEAKIAFYPSNESQEIRDYFTTQGFNPADIITFESAEDIRKYVDNDKYAAGLDDSPPNLHCAVEVTDLDGPAYKYGLRFNTSSSSSYGGAVSTQDYSPTNFYQGAYDNEWKTYDRRVGFTLFQDIIDTFILTKEGVLTWPGPEGDTTLAHDDAIKRSIVPMPTQDYVVDDFSSVVGDTLGFILTLIFIWPLTRIISSLVEEKELKLKASMQLMGLGAASLFWSWLTTYAVIFAIISILLCLCSFWGLYSYSFIIFIFLLYWFFGLTVFAVGYVISAFFDNAKTASTMGSIIFLVTFFISFVSEGPGVATSTKLATCLIPTVCLSQTGSIIAKLEGLGIGVTTATISEKVDNFTVQMGIGMLVFDIFFYLIIGIYLNLVTTSHFGISKPWYFICQPSFWCGTRYSRQGSPCGFCTEVPSDRTLPDFNPDGSNEEFTQMEPPLRDDEPIIQIRELRKTFPGSTGQKRGCCRGYDDFIAVKGASLDMYKGQIFILLGPNGAGKSTIFNMLTGLLPATSGEALLNGFSLSKDIGRIYSQQGVCFQHDVLYPNLTVYEHMRLFAAIKEMDMSKVDDEILQLLDTVGLGPKGDNKANSLSSTLSGGQKRKLSVAISLLNNPRVLFLDEMSTGVDVHSVRQLWKVLLEARKDRVIVMTTHDMQEASSIADRIGIMASGRLMCSGSNLFLKEKYGVGYTLTINKMTNNIDAAADYLEQGDVESALSPESGVITSQNDATVSLQSRGGGDITRDKPAMVSTQSGKIIRNYLVSKFPFALLSSDNAGEICFKLPLSAAAHFPTMLDALDKDKESLNISTYGLGITSLSEVFLKVIAGQSREEVEHEDEIKFLENKSNKNYPTTSPPTSPHSDDQLNNLELQHSTTYGSVGTTTVAQKYQPASDGPQGQKKGVIDDTWGTTANNITQMSSSHIFWRHFRALFIKRWNNFRRDGKAALWQLVYPGIILLGGLFALKFAVTTEMARRDLTASLYSEFSPQLIIGNPLTTNPGVAQLNEAMVDIAGAYSHTTLDVVTTNTTTAGIQQWLFDDFYNRGFQEARFGAVTVTDSENIPTTNPLVPPKLTLSLHINTTAVDSLPVYTNFINNALLNTANENATIELVSAPLPRTKRLITLINSTTAFILAIAMSFVPASYAAYVVRERQDQVKHLQMVSGVSNLAYWLSNLAWDVTNFILPFLLIIIILFGFNIEPFMEPAGAILVIVSLWMFVLAACPFTYAISFLFDSHTTAQNMTLLLNFLSSVVLLVLSFLLTIIESTREANKVLRFFYRLIPSYTLGDTIMQLLIRKQIYPLSKSPWELNIGGWNLIFFVFDFFLYTGLIILFEHWASNNTWEWIKGGCSSISATDDEKFRDSNEDQDVVELRKQIESGQHDDVETYPIVLRGLRKVYPTKGGEPFMAVSNVFLSVKQGQVLGFLGANGAGKTTTMKMLTSDIYPSEGSGDATLGGFSLLHQSEKIRHLLGYCPQFDALLPLLTGRQHLRLYAAIKCVPAEKIDGFVNYMLDKLGLQHLADRPAGTYSGGNRRKLSLGIAIVGNPLVLLLDEVSSGVDNFSKLKIWDLVSSTMANRAVILVSHSLEEIEALSTKIAIFASGRVRAYGTSLHLKQRHGNGLQIELQCLDGKQVDVQSWFEKEFSQDLSIVEKHRVTLKYAIPKDHYNLTSVFRIMEKAKQSGIGIESYSVSETSLDQIFIKFIKEDDERRAKNDGLRT